MFLQLIQYRRGNYWCQVVWPPIFWIEEMNSAVKKKRCAIYTRKSSEEGLEQEFNSLHAQREACEAYVRSQQGEGWKLIKTTYDDGGFSGGNMERVELHRKLIRVLH